MSAAADAGLGRMKRYDADRWPHGDKNRYQAGCRCDACRTAIVTYNRERHAARRRGEGNPYVSAARARRHLLALQKQGVGRDAVSAASDVPYNSITQIRAGRQRHVRALTERKLLAVTPDVAADSALVDAAETWRLIGELVEEGYFKKDLARMLGYAGRGICLNRKRITVRNAARVRDLHTRLTSEAALPLPVSKPRRNNAGERWPQSEAGRAVAR